MRGRRDEDFNQADLDEFIKGINELSSSRLVKLKIDDEQFENLRALVKNDFVGRFLGKLSDSKRMPVIRALGPKRFLSINGKRTDELLSAHDNLPDKDRIAFLQFLSPELVKDIIFSTADPVEYLPPFLKRLPKKDRKSLLLILSHDVLSHYLLGHETHKMIEHIIVLLRLLPKEDRLVCLKRLNEVRFHGDFFYGHKALDHTKDILSLFALLPSKDIALILQSAIDKTPEIPFINIAALKNLVADFDCFKLTIETLAKSSKTALGLLLEKFPTEINKLMQDACATKPDEVVKLLSFVPLEKWPKVITNKEQFLFIQSKLADDQVNVLVAGHVRLLVNEYKNYLDGKDDQLDSSTLSGKQLTRLHDQKEAMRKLLGLIIPHSHDKAADYSKRLQQFKEAFEHKDTKALFKDKSNIFLRIFREIANWLTLGRYEHKLIPAKTRFMRSVKSMINSPATMFKAKKQEFIVQKAKTHPPTHVSTHKKK